MVAVIIQARMESTRLPGKTMKKILGKPLLYYSYFRSKLAKYIDDVIIATTTNPKDRLIVKWCKENNIKYFRGSENDVLDRYYQAAKFYNINEIVRVTSDNPFVSPEIIDLGVLIKKLYEADYVSNRVKKRTWPYGLDIEVFSFEALERAWKSANKREEREHVTPYIYHNPEKFELYEFSYSKDISNIKLTVDYPEDFEKAQKMLELLIKKYGMSFSMKEIIKE